MNRLNSVVLLIVFSGLLAACSQNPTPENIQTPTTAVDLAHAEVEQFRTASDSEGSATPQAAEQTLTLPNKVIIPPAHEKKQMQNDGGLPTMPQAKNPAPSVPETLLKDEDKVVLDYEQVDLRDILQEFSDVMGIPMLIDSSISDKVTMRTPANKPLLKKDLWPLLQLLLKDAGIVMEQKGDVYHVKKSQDVLPNEIGGLSATLGDSNEPAVLQITPLRFVALESGEASIKPLIEPEGRVLRFDGLNALGIVTTPDKLDKVNRLLNLIDADPFVHRGMRLYRLKNAKAKEVQAELDNILKAVEGNKPAYSILTLERLNAVLVVAPPNRGFVQITQWVDVLDEHNESGGEQIFIYPVRNLKAASLATTLREAFKQENEDLLPPADKEAAPEQPLDETKNAPETKPEEPKPVTPTAHPTAVSAELKINIVADEDTNSLVIKATPRDYQQLLGTIALLDRVPKEVMINVVVAEVELTDTTKFGIDWSFLIGDRNALATNLGSDTGSIRSTVKRGEDGVVISPLGLSYGHIAGRLTAALNMIATDSNVTLLSRPSLLVKNNQEASINVGSDVPTITTISTSTTTSTTSNQVQYRQTGIILKVKPHINDDGIINMEVSQEISSVGADRDIAESPTFNQRKVETSVVVRDQGVIVLGGLIQTRLNNSKRGIPKLKDVPEVGLLFSNTSLTAERTELVVIIVPQIINPEVNNEEYVQGFNRRMRAVQRLFDEQDMPYFNDKLK
jgi:general secretion pathway protein D